MKFCINGKFVKESNALISVLDSGFQYGDGFYDTMRTYQGIVFEFELHLQRIKRYGQAIGIPMWYSLEQIEKWVKKLVRVNALREARIKLIITRGVKSSDFLTCEKPTLVITCKPLWRDPAIYHGVSALTLRLQRILPEVKTMGLTAMMVAYRTVVPQGAYEAILIDHENFVCEGASTNVFMVRNGIIVTPKSNILQGFTRNRVITLAKERQLSIKIENFKVHDLINADEIFLTNCPREVMPVTKLNKKRVGSGKVGPITKIIMKIYNDYVQDYCQRGKKLITYMHTLRVIATPVQIQRLRNVTNVIPRKSDNYILRMETISWHVVKNICQEHGVVFEFWDIERFIKEGGNEPIALMGDVSAELALYSSHWSHPFPVDGAEVQVSSTHFFRQAVSR